MKNYIIRYYDAASSALGIAGGASAALGPVGLGLAGAQTALGIVQAIQGDKLYDKYSPQLKAFKTPDEIVKIANATAARAGGGLSPATLQYLTGNADRALGASLGAATRLGGDSNDLSSLYDNYASTILDIGNMNELENMKNFEKYLTGQQLLADNDAAEQASQQALVRDKLQKAGVDKISGLQNIAGGANTAIGTLSAIGTSNLFSTGADPAAAVNPLAAPSSYVAPNPVSAVPAPNLSSQGLARTTSGVTLPSNVNQAAIEQAMETLRRAGLMQRAGGIKN